MSNRLNFELTKYCEMSLLVWVFLQKQLQNCFIFYMDTIVSSSCFATLDYIATCFFKHLAKEDKKTLRDRDISQDGQRSLHFMQQNPEVLQQVNSQSFLWDITIFLNSPGFWGT